MEISHEILRYPRWWKYGLPRPDMWIQHVDIFARFIKEFNLKPVAPEHLQDVVTGGYEMEMPALAARSTKALVRKPIPFPGGMRIPHIHFKGDLYLVNEAQWGKMAAVLLEDFRGKLAGVKQVSFEQVMELSETMSSL